MSHRTVRRALVAAAVCVLGSTGVAAAQEDQRGIDPMQGLSLVEVKLDNKAEAMVLQLDAEKYGIEFNDHYLRNNPDGSIVVTVFGTEDDFDRLEGAGYDVGATIEGPRTYDDRIDERQADVRQENRADAAALDQPVTTAADEDELVVLRVDYFENYAGRFLSVEAKTRLGGVDAAGAYAGPELSLSYNRGNGTPIDSTPRTMAINVDPDTEPNTYIEHRELVRIGEVGTTEPRKPTRIRIGSSTGATIEADVETWLGGGLPPMSSRFIKDFTTRYMDPTEVYDRFDELAREFPNIAQLIPLPHRTNGYQRKAQANMAGGTPIGNTPPGSMQDGTVVLTSRAWGHEGGNDISAEFRAGSPSSALSVSVTGKDILVNLATDATGAPTSTAAQVVQAINASPEASQLVFALTFRGNAGAGIVEQRAKINLSDFLTTTTNAHVQRGPFEYSVMRIGKKRNGSKVGVFLYCQQHAREWATPLTCLETAEQLLRNYAIDKRTRELVDNLDIFILPSSNPDGSHYSLHNFTQQRRNMTNWCVEGGEETDDPFATNFWTPRVNPSTGQPYTNTDPASRNAWGVDLNRNNTVGTLFDGYIGASHSCISDVYTGPGEASEPEIKNELWIADTFDNIKFSNNIHSFGGYFMWAPGAYLPDRGEGELVHANIGVEKYFFAAGDQILNRIKDHRNTAILPARTGPIADVLYSAGGNSADEHWYRRGVIAYSFETGADLYFTNFNSPIAAGTTGIRLSTNISGYEYLKAGDKLTAGAGGPNPETRTVAQVVRPNPQSPAPNVIFTEPLANSHAAPVRIEGAALQTAVGFQPDYATEGKHEALEFAAGNYGLLEEAYEYSRDRTDPKVRMTGPKSSRDPIETTFEWINEPSVIRYTMDGRKPNSNSPLWDSTGPREPGETFLITETTTFRWLATDIKGNTSTGSETFRIRDRGHWWDDDDDDRDDDDDD
jgi:zinc carboxypeptidase/chitobiase/beta-hexosaminidase-like protein